MTITTPQVITHEKFTARILANGIFYVRYKDGSVLEVEDLQASYNTYLELSEGKKLKIISELGEFTTATPEARKFGETLKLEAIAETMIFTGLAQRLLVRFFQLFRT